MLDPIVKWEIAKRVHFYVQIVGVGTVQPTSLVQHSRLKKKHLFHQKQQKSHDVLISRQKHRLDEIISLKEQVSEIAHLKSEFLALKTELAEVKEQNKRYEKKLSELITYYIFHTKTTKAQEEICFIVRREVDKVFSYPSEQTTGASNSTYLCDSYTHTYNITNHGNLTTVISTLPPVTTQSQTSILATSNSHLTSNQKS